MTRFIIFVLVVSVIFLSGMIVGMNQKEEAAQARTEVEVIEEVEADPVIQTYDHFSETNENQFTQKVASLAEKVISFVYELVITLMYQIAKLFTG